ncbi:unnamed protein product [Leptosia nina]|uniref:Uncharacterized protein n=1 Tax=Leptosia nina TaxID=320188 RepID=A0AAV1J7E7_9NEOP
MYRPQLPASGDNEYVHIRCLIANIHKPRNVSRPPESPESSLEAILECSPSDRESSPAASERSDRTVKSDYSDISEVSGAEEQPPPGRAKSNSIAGATLMPPSMHNKRRRQSFLHLHVSGANDHPGPLSAGAHLNVPRFTVTAPPGEGRRFSHGFPFHGFALRRHSNMVCTRICGRCESFAVRS